MSLNDTIGVLEELDTLAEVLRHKDVVVVYPLSILDQADTWDTYLIVGPSNSFLTQVAEHSDGAQVIGFHKAFSGAEVTVTSEEEYEAFIPTTRKEIADSVIYYFGSKLPELVAALRNPTLFGLDVCLRTNLEAVYKR